MTQKFSVQMNAFHDFKQSVPIVLFQEIPI